MTDFIKKYHTYIVATVAFLTVAFQVATGTQVPEFVYGLEGAIGLGSVRVTMQQTSYSGASGWKTYALAIALGTIAALRAFGINIPLEVDGVIASLATATLASASKKEAE